MSLTPLGDALSKQLGTNLSPFLIVFLRYFSAGLIALVIAAATRTPIFIPRHGRLGMFIRTVLVMAAMIFLVSALSRIPLATAIGGFLIAPVVAVLLSVWLLHERLTWPRAMGAFASFVGAALILKPVGGVDVGTLFALLGGLSLGAFLALSRGAIGICNPLSALAVQCLLGAAMVLPIAAADFNALSADYLWPILWLGVVTAVTHFLTVMAYQRAEASQLAPFFYFNLVAAIFVGWLWFGEVPDMISMGGFTLILAGGLISLIPAIKNRSLLINENNGLPKFHSKLPEKISKNG